MPFGQTSWGHTSKDSHSSHTFTEYTDAVCQWQCVVPCCDSCLISKCSKCQWSLKEHEAGAKSPCFHALKGSPVSLKVTLIPKRPKEGGGGEKCCFQRAVCCACRCRWKSPCAPTSFEPSPYSASVPPGLSQNSAFSSPETSHTYRLMGFVLMSNPHKFLLLFQSEAHASLFNQGYTDY